jgi:hypothetical protein
MEKSILKIKAKIADITIPLLIALMIELFLIGAGFRELIIVVIYLIIVITYDWRLITRLYNQWKQE